MDDAEFFLPSEIARLVYGHLKTNETNDVPAKFLNECSDLSECRELQKRNRTFKTEANGLSLKEILDQYLNMNKISTVNQLVGKSQKFTDPVEALNYLLSDTPKEKKSCSNVNFDNQDSLEGYSSNCSEDMFSDFSLNLKTPDKHKSCEEVTKNIPETVIELNDTIDKNTQETTPESNKLTTSGPTSDVVIRQSTRLQLKKTLKNDRSCNSDSVKELRVNPNDDCETPRKLGNPPYSENKLLKPRTSISLLSSDSEQESTQESELSIVKTPSTVSSAVAERLNGLFSPEWPKTAVKKKTLKVMRPRRPPSCAPSSSGETPGDNEKINCKRNRLPALCSSNSSNNENKKSKLFGESDKPTGGTNDGERVQRTSDELVFISDAPQVAEKPKMRRKSGPVIPVNDDKWNSLKLNKSLPVIDDMVLGEKLIKNKKLQEHIAANINEVITNSPQKKFGESDPVDFDELIKNSLAKIIDDPLYEKFESDVIDLMFGQGFASEQSCSDVSSQVEATRNETTSTTEINAQTQISCDVTTDIDKPLTNNNDDIQPNEHEQNPAIIIEIREDQTANQEPYVERTTTVSEELRNYWSNIPGIESSPDAKLGNASKSDENTSVINLIAPNGEIAESCKVTNNASERIVYSSNSILFPLNDGIPMVTIGKGSEFQICGTPSTISRVGRKHQYVPIAPKPNNAVLSTEKSIDACKVLKKRRTRGGKRA